MAWDEPEIGRVYGGCMALFDEPGAGKTKQVIDAAQILFKAGEITHVIVVVPNQVRPHWFSSDPLFGELAKYRFPEVGFHVVEYRAKSRQWTRGPKPCLTWIITNFEFIRQESRIKSLMSYGSQKTMLVVDESSAVGNHRAKQTRAVFKLRKLCSRVIILNGTPESTASGVAGHADPEEDETPRGSVGNLYSQAAILDPKILGCRTHHEFIARYARLGGWKNRQVVEWINVEDIQDRMKPYVLRRLKRDCMDLPQALPPVTLTATMTPELWSVYKQMRDDAIAWLSASTVAVTKQAGVRVMRMAQIASGQLGGLQKIVECECLSDEERDPEDICELCGGSGVSYKDMPPQMFNSPTIDLCLDTLEGIFREKADAKVVIWCRFVHELRRLNDAIGERFPRVTRGMIVGGQTRDERDLSLRLLKPATAPAGPVAVACTPASGSVGLDFAAGSHVLWASHGTSLKERLQAVERVHRMGQVNNVWSGEILVCGPQGQKTITHTLLRALRRKERSATWTCSQWVTALKEEENEE